MNALTFAAAQALRVVPRKRVTRLMGRLADVRWSPSLGRAVMGMYCKAYDVALDECLEGPNDWPSFDAFFTRALKPGARPIEGDARTIACPADGRIESMGRVDKDRRFAVKGRPYSVDELVGDPGEARRYERGAGCVVYLSPRDYHRVHSPIDGTITEVRSIAGDYYPVNSIGLAHVRNLFARNRRVSIAIDSSPSSGLGRVTVVMVSAMVVGRVTVTGIHERDVPIGLQKLSPGVRVARGDEIGVFHLGSTAVVFLEERAIERWLAAEGPVRMGQGLAFSRSTVVSTARSDG